MYCSPGENEGPILSWCNSLYPDVYGYVQKNYWKSGFLQQLNRGFHDSYLESIPVNLINLYVCLSLVFQQESKPYFSLVSKTALPLFVHYLLLMLFINLFANLEIIMRVSSTHPVYFWSCVYLMAKPNKSRFEQV
eukprot:CAMPEP_0168320906 /NCGR_PEP_ID=MMETSP0213-20121227/1953_1 /TAXON_ID=151035 /ORGANISM="Euplotes harpa, Strain FSP1.4" /LENGTH=134 /DNA_ID=CAMNT_0008322453 /DNA_START=763 /DNA_END=1164 /DNA_ORIENTATION=-